MHLADSFIMCQTAFTVIPSPHAFPTLLTLRKSLPRSMPAAPSHTPNSLFTQSGTGTVRTWPELRQNSMRTENGTIPCDGCPIQGIPSPSSAKILSRRSTRAVYLYILRMEEPGRFHDATLVRIRQPDRTGGAALPGAHGKGRDLRLWCEFFRLAFPSRVRHVCCHRVSSD